MLADLQAFADEFDPRLDAYLRAADEIPTDLLEAVRYSALAPGKRLRPFLTVRCCEIAGGARDAAWAPAAAVECVHAFSLIHDDLPAMDDDDFRRGRPTCHKRYGEATAILAGDALIVLAFELLAREVPDGARATAMIRELAGGAGWAGMIGGQAADMAGESVPADEALTRSIHLRKTAALIRASCRIGVIAAAKKPTDGGDELIETLGRYGERFGLAFQIADDLLDVTATRESAGKRVGKDAGAHKQTYPASVGIEESRRAAARAANEAIAALDGFGAQADDLRALVRFVASQHY